MIEITNPIPSSDTCETESAQKLFNVIQYLSTHRYIMETPSFITSLLFSIAACGEDSAAPEPATEEMTDVEDIPVPSEDKEEDENEDSQSTDEPDPEQPAETLRYTFSDGDSLLYVQVYKDPSALGANLSHNHVMRAANFLVK